jgi:hypothetical protein
MSEIVNLNQFRKSKRRADEKKSAEDNRVKFGRTKAERKAAKAAQSALERDLDGKKLPPQDKE